MGVEPGMALNQMTMEGGVDKAKRFIQIRLRMIQGKENSQPPHPLSFFSRAPAAASIDEETPCLATGKIEAKLDVRSGGAQ